MAWRLHDHIVRGEIDNRERDRVTGRLWLAGIEEPLELELIGNCRPDLAGCTLNFENPAPIPLTTKPPAFMQRGQAGYISAGRKVRVFDVPIEEALDMAKRGEKPPEHMANCLYLEWFSSVSGRVVIESSDFRLKVSEPVWQFSPEEIAEMNREAAEASEDSAFVEEFHAEDDGEWDEFRSEQLLRESDMMTDKYGRLLEKYADHPDRERIVAHEMGWTWLIEALDEQAANAASGEQPNDSEEDSTEEPPDADEELPDPTREGIDWVRDQHERVIHPVEKHARDTLFQLFDELKSDGTDLAETDELIGRFTGHFQTLYVKLSAALGFIARDTRLMDRGLVIAWLKRALEIHNETLAAADALNGSPVFPADRVEYYRGELFRIRESVLRIITELRESSR